MIIFLYGPDDYRRLGRKSEIIAAFRKKHSELGLGFFDGEADGTLNTFAEFAKSGALFESAKLAIFDNAFEIEPPALAKALAPVIAAKETTVLISEKDKPVKSLAFLLKNPVLSERFENMEGAEWLGFIKAEAKKLRFELADDAARFLATVYQGNSWALVTELQKLSGFKPAIQKSDLDKLDLEAAPNYWALVNGIRSLDARTRLFALEKLFSVNDPPPKIFNILAAQAGEKTPRMAEYDFAVKSGKLEYEEAILDLVLS